MASKRVDFNVGWISGMPRSGTTWLSQIFASSPDVRMKFCPLFSYEFKNALDEKATKEQWENLFLDVYETKSEYMDQEHLRKRGLVPLFAVKKSHPNNMFIKSTRYHNLIPEILSLNIGVRFIYLVRNPCATLYSWMSNPNEFPQGCDPLREWRSGSCRKDRVGEFWGFDDWVTVTQRALQLSQQYPKDFIITRYENLVQDPLGVAGYLFDYYGIELTDETRNFIELSCSRHDQHKHSVFKKPVKEDAWVDNLPLSIVSECRDELLGTELECFID